MRQAAELSLQLASIPLQLHSSIARTLTGKYGVTVREDNPVAERHLGLEASGELAALISMTCDLITVGLLLAGRLRRSSEEKTPNSEASADRFNEELETMPDGGMAMRQFMAKEVSTLELELTTKEVRYTLRVHDAGRVVIVEGHRYRDDDPSS